MVGRKSTRYVYTSNGFTSLGVCCEMMRERGKLMGTTR